MPKSLGNDLDALYKLDQRIDDAENVVRTLKRIREANESKILKQFDKAQLDGGKGKLCLAIVKESKFPSINNQRKFWKYVKSKNAYELVQNRISSRAYFDRLEEGEKVPGVKVFTKKSVQLRKRK